LGSLGVFIAGQGAQSEREGGPPAPPTPSAVGYHPFYAPYLHTHRPFGLSAITDQQLAGAVMMTEGSLVTIAALVWLALRYLEQAEAGQRLIDAGAEPGSVARAIRYERAHRS
jgi:hypothetical protein